MTYMHDCDKHVHRNASTFQQGIIANISLHIKIINDPFITLQYTRHDGYTRSYKYPLKNIKMNIT